ncbi:MAG: hypothetical protein FJ202_07725 [Gemmatimonadetes bacterium]|nr:hypothetical protein [Gemmatimonadota bacterium]
MSRFVMSRFAVRRRAGVMALVLAGAGLVGACREELDSGAVCSSASVLCPGQSLEIRDTIIDPTLEFDSTYAGFPARGGEVFLPLISRGDTLQVNAVVRFDSLVTFYLPALDTARTITYVDSARIRLILDLTRSQVPDSVTFELYDVDATDDDTATAPIAQSFVPSRRLGQKTFAKAQVVDSVFVPISDLILLKRLRDSTSGKGRLRVGIRARGTGPLSFRIGATEGGQPARLYYRPSADTSARALQVAPASSTPTNRLDVLRDLLDWTVVEKSNLPVYPNTMQIGGVPGRRVYMRFNLPRRITDSTTILRATLRLTQRPYAFGSARDTLIVRPHIVLASPNITDYRRASQLIGLAGLLVTDSIVVTPRDSGQKSLELYPLVRSWGAQASLSSAPPRAVVLISVNEGTLPRMAAFWSANTAGGLRPTMRITYVPRNSAGVP